MTPAPVAGGSRNRWQGPETASGRSPRRHLDGIRRSGRESAKANKVIYTIEVAIGTGEAN